MGQAADWGTATISRILSVGMEASYAKKITNEDVLAFADLSGDVNPVHLSDDFAAGTIFKKRIAHGFLTGSLFSTVLGTKLPGPGLHLSLAEHEVQGARSISATR